MESNLEPIRKVADTELEYLKLLLDNVHVAEESYKQYAAFLTKRYGLSTDDTVNLQTGNIEKLTNREKDEKLTWAN